MVYDHLQNNVQVIHSDFIRDDFVDQRLFVNQKIGQAKPIIFIRDDFVTTHNFYTKKNTWFL